MLRSTLLVLLPLLIYVAGQEGRARPLPVLGRPRPFKLGSPSVSPAVKPPVAVAPQPPVVAVTQPPVVAVTQPPVVAVTQPPVFAVTQPPVVAVNQPPQVVPTPQVIIQLVAGPQTPGAATIPAQSASVVEPVVVAATVQPQHEIPQVPVVPEEEPVFEPNPEPQPESEPQPKPELKPEPELKPDEILEFAPEFDSQPKVEIPSTPSPYPQRTKPQLTFVAVPEAEPKPVQVKPVAAALPPLLPKPKPIREPVYGRQTPAPVQYPITVTTVTQRVTKAPPVIITAAPPKPVPFKQDYVCKEGNGFYAVANECDSYIECKYNKATQHWCPDGLHFNPAAKRYEYPCAYPSAVQCTAGSESRNPSPTGQCPRQYGFFSTSDGDCTKYIVCQEGAATVLDCPAGLVFNPHVQSCDWVENVPHCNPNVFKNYVCPEPPVGDNGLVSDVVYKYRYEQHCDLYVACQKGYPRLLSCDLGLSFDEDSQSCVDEEYVRNCNPSYEQHCDLYVACQKGYPRLLSCDLGLSFDEDSQSCVDEEYVRDCNRSYVMKA